MYLACVYFMTSPQVDGQGSSYSKTLPVCLQFKLISMKSPLSFQHLPCYTINFKILKHSHMYSLICLLKVCNYCIEFSFFPEYCNIMMLIANILSTQPSPFLNPLSLSDLLFSHFHQGLSQGSILDFLAQ